MFDAVVVETDVNLFVTFLTSSVCKLATGSQIQELDFIQTIKYNTWTFVYQHLDLFDLFVTT